MGNFFSEPERCGGCRTREPGKVVWKIQYTNWVVEEYFNNMLYHLNPEDIENRLTGQSIFDIARSQCEKISVGYICLSLSDKFQMTQFLCEKCMAEISLDDLPQEWGYETEYLESGWRRFELP